MTTDWFLLLLAACLGIVCIAIVLQDAFEVMLLPRRVTRRVRLASIGFRLIWRAWVGLSQRLDAGRKRESFLSHFGPLSMLLLFATWATGLIIGFGLLEWSVQSAPYSPLAEQIYMSGVTFFTLGYGDIVPHSPAGRVISVIEAGNGIGFIAVVIGYLPLLYQFLSRREAHVILLDGRAGSPPAAGTLLVRHAEGQGLDKLDELFREWETWGAELLESHLAYPMLAYYRSQHDNQSWLAALGCVMDACALVLVGVQEMRPLQARMTFTMARQILVAMTETFRVQPSRYSGGDRLDHATYLHMEQAFADAGVGWVEGADSEAVLAALRATYEPMLDALAQFLELQVPGWLPDDAGPDNWERGPRGLIARNLVEELSARTTPGIPTATSTSGSSDTSWHALRHRLQRPRK